MVKHVCFSHAWEQAWNMQGTRKRRNTLSIFSFLDLILEHANDKDVAFLVVGDPFGWVYMFDIFPLKLLVFSTCTWQGNDFHPSSEEITLANMYIYSSHMCSLLSYQNLHCMWLPQGSLSEVWSCFGHFLLLVWASAVA